MRRSLPLLILLLSLVAGRLAGVGFADGIKIGEVTPDAVVLWTRATAEAEAEHRVDPWDPEVPSWRVPGKAASVRFVLRSEDDPREFASPWAEVGPETDFCHQTRIESLHPSTRYEVEAQARLRGSDATTATFQGHFTTAPDATGDRAVRFTVSTCQEFRLRDDRTNGHRIYASMLELTPDFFIQTGDTLYYDKPEPFARDVATARYKWNRLYALPNLRRFHAKVASYWMHDDHDLLKDDCWPGQRYGELGWDDGLRIWREQIPQSDKSYRNFRWGRHVEIWLPEGREFRSPNPTPDGPGKSILGKEQWHWLETSMRASDATFKLYVSATPVVGPDRKNKNDNHANDGFRREGERLRQFLAGVPGCFVINGDRHWQYHSVDTDTGLHEFGSGPASDSHAGGFREDLKEPWQDFLRIKGGFLSVEADAARALVRHHDVEGRVVHTTTIPAE